MKKVQPTWIYIIGTLILFGVLVLLAKDIFIPRFFNRSNLDFTQLQKPSSDYLKSNIDYLANLDTSEGAFTIDLFEGSAPKNTANFIYLSESKYYNSVLFHRVIPNLLIQGGDRNTLDNDRANDGTGKAPYFIEDEVNWKSLNLPEDRIKELEALGYKSNNNLSSYPLEKYSLAMANNGPNTNSSQFFIVLVDGNDTRLQKMQGQYTVIGKVISGQDTINKIASIPVDNTIENIPRPTKDIRINSIKITTK